MSELGYLEHQPTRAELDQLRGVTAVMFGTNWCGYCRAAHQHFAEAFERFADVNVVRVEDGKGRPLGRSFSVKLWPTMVVLRDGVEVARVVRPHSTDEICEALQVGARGGT